MSREKCILDGEITAEEFREQLKKLINENSAQDENENGTKNEENQLKTGIPSQ